VGQVTPDGARIRWIMGMIALTSFAYATGTLLWALIWQIGCLIYDYCGGSKHWYLKTFLGGIGVIRNRGGLAVGGADNPNAGVALDRGHWVVLNYADGSAGFAGYGGRSGGGSPDNAAGVWGNVQPLGNRHRLLGISLDCALRTDGACGFDAGGDRLGSIFGGVFGDDRGADVGLSESPIGPSHLCGVYAVVMCVFGLFDRGFAGLDYALWANSAAIRSGANTPNSVMIPAIKCAGVTSNAGL
jgi:hypothetical protein